MTVFLASSGKITPKGDGRVVLTPQAIDLAEWGKKAEGWSIDKEFLRGKELESKALMSLHTQLAVLAFMECLKGVDLNLFNERGIIYVGNGPISLDDSTIRGITKYLVFDDHLDFHSLGENIERMPPLDGIKMLSTAQSHFIAKVASTHELGNQLYSGSNTSLNCLVEAYHAIKSGRVDFAVVVSAEAPFYKNSFLEANRHIDASVPFAEGGFSTLLVSGELIDKYRLKKHAALHHALSSMVPSTHNPHTGFNEKGLLNHWRGFSSPLFIDRFIDRTLSIPKSKEMPTLRYVEGDYYFGSGSGLANFLTLVETGDKNQLVSLTSPGTGGHVSSLQMSAL